MKEDPGYEELITRGVSGEAPGGKRQALQEPA